MNPAAILALISNLYEQIVALQEENDRLRAQDGSTTVEQHERGEASGTA